MVGPPPPCLAPIDVPHSEESADSVESVRRYFLVVQRCRRAFVQPFGGGGCGRGVGEGAAEFVGESGWDGGIEDLLRDAAGAAGAGELE